MVGVDAEVPQARFGGGASLGIAGTHEHDHAPGAELVGDPVADPLVGAGNEGDGWGVHGPSVPGQAVGRVAGHHPHTR